MGDNSNTLQLTLQIREDGSIVIDQVAGKIKGMGDATESAASKSSGMFSKIKDNWVAFAAGATASYLAITKVTDSILTNIKTAAALTNEIDRQAKVIGISTDAFQKYQFIAKMSDVSNDNLAIGLKMLSRNMEEVSRGTGLTKDYFDAMGISVTTTNGKLKPLDQIMGEIADKFSTWEDGPRKIAISMELFGRSGETLIPFLNKGKSGFEELSREAEKLGIILSPGLVQKGSETEDIFKRMEARTEALKKSFYPAAFEATKAADSILKDFNRLNDWLKTNKTTDWFPWLTDLNKNLKENSLDNWLTKIGLKIPKVTYDIQQLKKEMTSAPTVELIQPPDPNILEGWLAIYHQEIDAMRELGVTSQSSFQTMAKAAKENLAIVKKSFEEGKASGLDYAKSLKAANDMLKKGLEDTEAPKKFYKTMGDLQEAYFDNGTEYYTKLNKIAYDPTKPEEYYEKIKALQDETAKKDAELNQKMNDLWKQKPVEIIDIPKLEAENAQILQKFDALGIKIKGEEITPQIDTSKIILQLGGIEYSYKDLKNRIESNPIQIKIQQEGGGGGISGGGGGLNEKLKYLGADGKEYDTLSEANNAGFSGASPLKWASDVNANVNFTATGMSPKISLGDAFIKIMANFSTMQEKSSAMEATINFAELSNNLKTLQKSYDAYQEIINSQIQIMKAFSSFTYESMEQNQAIKDAMKFQSGIADQMKLLKLQQYYDLYKAGIPGAEDKYNALFKQYYGTLPSYQQGISYVPRTGLALVHQGETITPANQNFSMGGMINHFHFQGSNAKEIAEEIAHVLEYNLSGRLKKAIRKTASRQ